MPIAIRPRYEGLADWYDDYNADAAAAHQPEIRNLLGSGTGRCLDLGCGTGQYFGAIGATGHTSVGLDLSTDQLRLARRHHVQVVCADAAHLPFADNTFAAATALWLSTDVDDFSGVLMEIARVVEPGGVFVFFGVHPCFNGPCVENGADGRRIVHSNYRAAGWHADAPWWGENIRRRVGMRHVPLAELLTAFPHAGLFIERVVEPHAVAHPVPWALGIRSRVS